MASVQNLFATTDFPNFVERINLIILISEVTPADCSDSGHI